MVNKLIINSIYILLFCIIFGCSSRITKEDVQSSIKKNNISTLVNYITDENCDNDAFIDARSYIIKNGKISVPFIIKKIPKINKTRWILADILSEIGPDAIDAVPLIIDSLCIKKSYVKEVLREYQKEGKDFNSIFRGGIVAYQVYRTSEAVALDTIIHISPEAHSKMKTLEGEFGKYIAFTEAEIFAETYTFDTGEKYFNERLFVDYEINYSAIALRKILLQDYGTDQKKWKEDWLIKKNKIK
jgi:hypothetical protein